MTMPAEEVVSEETRKNYEEEYNALECKNLTLEEFITNRHSKRLHCIREIGRYAQMLSKGIKIMNNVEISKIPPKGMLPRTIIIDGPNVMHGGSPYLDLRAEKSGAKIPDVAALLSLVRYFISRNFEVIIVISRKYALKDGTNYQTAIEELVKNHLCIITPKTNLDDTICLDFAAQLNGIVVTTDKYRDHANESERYRRIVNANRLHIQWVDVSNKNQNTRTVKDGDFVAGKRFEFRNDNGKELTTEEAQQRLYVRNDAAEYQLTKERIDLMQTHKKAESTLALICTLIIEGISVCKENAIQIVRTPLPGPTPVVRNDGYVPSARQPDRYVDEMEEDDW